MITVFLFVDDPFNTDYFAKRIVVLYHDDDVNFLIYFCFKTIKFDLINNIKYVNK